MKLGELKKSLAKFSPDMDDEEVVISYMNGKNIDFDNLAFTGVLTSPAHCIVIGSVDVTKNFDQLGTITKKEDL